MQADFHLHSSFSGDSETPPEEMIRSALQKNLSLICFTDHFDEDYPYADISMVPDEPSYITSIRKLREKYRSSIDIRLGAEFGLQPHLASVFRRHAENPYDFIIGSTHLVDREDPYYPDFWKAYDAERGVRRYLEVTLENIRSCRDFDVYGHIDYIVRYAPAEPKAFSYRKYADLIDEILRLLIEQGKGIEVNTGGYRVGLGVPNPCPDVLRRYRELGGEIITIGSDAHSPEYIGFRFDEAQDILKTCGFRYFTVFQERKPEFVKL